MIVRPDLAGFLARHSPVLTEAVVWGDAYHFRVAAYLSDEQPPIEYVTSVRAVVIRDDSVLVQRDQNSLHILPGGRREADESLEVALRREVREETGWTLHPPSPLGFMHFHHLDPKPANHPYPHPDFIQVVYVARAATYAPEAKLSDGYEIESVLHPIAGVRTLGLSQREPVYLAAALRTTAGSMSTECGH